MFMRKHDNFTMREVKLKCNVTHQKFQNLSKNIKIIVKRNRINIGNKIKKLK